MCMRSISCCMRSQRGIVHDMALYAIALCSIVACWLIYIMSCRAIYMCIYIYIYTYIHTYIHTCIHTYIHTYVCTHVYVYIYIYITVPYHIVAAS